MSRGFLSRLILNEIHEQTKQEQFAQSTGLKCFEECESDLFRVDIGQTAPVGSSWVKPATEVADVLLAEIVRLLDLDAGIGFDMRDDTNMAVAAVIPAGDGANLRRTAGTESSSSGTSCPLTAVAPVISCPRS